MERLPSASVPAGAEPADAFLDTVAELFNEKSTDQLQHEFFEQFGQHSAESWRCRRDLKRSENVDNQDTPSNFSRLSNLPVPRYGAITMPENRPITIRDLYPHMSEEELAVAEANLKRYAAVVVRIYDRLKAEGQSWPEAGALPSDLTLSGNESSIPDERSNPPKKRN